MWRTTFLLFFTLSGIISALVFWQWHVYSQPLNQASKPDRATQHISVKSEQNQLTVTQTFKDLSAESKYNIIVGNSIAAWTCGKKASSCIPEVDQPYTVKTSSIGEISFQLSIPFPNRNVSFLLEEWLIQIPSIKITSTEVEITAPLPSNGTWVAGLPLQGWSTLELIQYYVFKGTASTPALYWHPNHLKYQGNDKQGNSYFIEQNESMALPNLQVIARLSDFPKQSIIVSNSNKTTVANGLSFVSQNVKDQQIERQLLESYIRAKLKEPNEWLVDLFVAALLGDSPSSTKAKGVLSELTNVLGKQKLSSFVLTELKESEITVENLDSKLSMALSKKTHFFHHNSVQRERVVPFYYEIKKQVKTPLETAEIQLVIYQQRKLYPLNETLRALGYKVNILSDNETILLTNGPSSYRFYVGQNVFIHNEEDYGLLESPLTLLNGKVFMEEQWIKSLFKVEISETEKLISLTSEE